MLFGIAWAGAGWVQAAEGKDFVPPHSIRQARHGMIFSAICGAAGLWVSALSTAMVLGGIGTAALAAAMAQFAGHGPDARAERAARGARARSRVLEHYRLEAVARQHAELWAGLAGRGIVPQAGG
jgi:hypothetical protein